MSVHPPPPYMENDSKQYKPYGQPGHVGVYSQPGQVGNYGPPATTGAYGYSNNVVVVTQPGAGMTARHGSCVHCGIGYPQTSFTVCGILLAIIFFPLGIVCCLMLTERRCTHCGAGL